MNVSEPGERYKFHLTAPTGRWRKRSPQIRDERWTLLTNWRQAIAQQLLTPAPDTAAMALKKAALAAGAT
jgi:hypothetical protein